MYHLLFSDSKKSLEINVFLLFFRDLHIRQFDRIFLMTFFIIVSYFLSFSADTNIQVPIENVSFEIFAWESVRSRILTTTCVKSQHE